MSNTALKSENPDISSPLESNDAYYKTPVIVVDYDDIESGKVSAREAFQSVCEKGARLLVKIDPLFEGQEADFVLLENREHPGIAEANLVGRVVTQLDDLDEVELGNGAGLNQEFAKSIAKVVNLIGGEKNCSPREITHTDMNTDTETTIYARRVRASLKPGLRAGG